MSGFATPKQEPISIITPDIKQTAAYQAPNGFVGKSRCAPRFR